MEIPRNVGAHNPTKIPNRSAWALSSEVVPLFIYQIEIDPTTDIRLKTNVIIDSVFIFLFVHFCSLNLTILYCRSNNALKLNSVVGLKVRIAFCVIFNVGICFKSQFS